MKRRDASRNGYQVIRRNRTRRKHSAKDRPPVVPEKEQRFLHRWILHGRMETSLRSRFSEASDDQRGPARLVARAEALPRVPVKIFVEEQQVAPVRVPFERRHSAV